MLRRVRIPKYRHYRPKDLALVVINGKQIYLGKYGSPESWDEYHRLVKEYQTQPASSLVSDPASPGCTIDELIAAFWQQHVVSYYVKNGRPTSEQDNFRQALRFLRPSHGHAPARDFGPKGLKAVRQEMIRAGRCRPVVNKDVNRIKRMFRWAVEHELVPVTVFQALQTVAGLGKGRSEAREPEPVGPVPEEHVRAVLAFVTAPVAAMIQLQRLTGARPGEVTALRPCDVARGPDGVWVYRPHEFKTEHLGLDRRILLGPRAQEVLLPWLDRAPEAYCFSPAEAVAARNARLRANRKSPMTPSQAARKPKARPKRAPGVRYNKDSYRSAIRRACRKAGVPVWHPNQLRHNAATEVRAKFGLDAAQAVLGHAKADVTQVYAERDLARARAVMSEIG
jgi:integrase